MTYTRWTTKARYCQPVRPATYHFVCRYPQAAARYPRLIWCSITGFGQEGPYADRAGHFVPVAGDGVVRISGLPVGVATCWEVVFDRAPRNSVLNGAQLLTVPSNNATFTKTMSEQQLAIAKVRAVEHDRRAARRAELQQRRRRTRQ